MSATTPSTQYPTRQRPTVAPDYSVPPFFVPSATERNKSYLVATGTDGFLYCDCPAKQGRKSAGRCWHVKAVASGAIKASQWKRPASTLARPPIMADHSRLVNVDDLYA